MPPEPDYLSEPSGETSKSDKIRRISAPFYHTLVAAMMDESDHEPLEMTRTKLDTHANMPVVGKDAYILEDAGHSASVSAYSPYYKPLELPIVNAALLYECKTTGEQYKLVVNNALFVKSMRVNLIPPFIMREMGLVLRKHPRFMSTCQHPKIMQS